jgi:metal-responsive CopG/Arc/MetJ family transcriptional regulator
MKSCAKVAVSLPAKTLRALDAASRRLGRSRSAVVSQAVEDWLAAHGEPSEEDRRYAEAYLRRPEPTAELASIAGAATSAWEPWE